MSQTTTLPHRPGSAEARSPDSVRLKAAEADDMIRRMNQESAAPAEGQNGGGSGSVPGDAGGGAEGVQSTASPPAAAPQAAPEPAQGNTATIDAMQAQLTRLEAEAATWRGRYQAELPRERQARDALEAELATLRAAAAAREVPVVAEITPATADEMEPFGADMFSVMERFIIPKIDVRMAALMANLEAKLTARIAGLDSNVTAAVTTVERSKSDDFVASLDSAIPNWKEIDGSAAFNTWLDAVDPIFDQSRRIGLDSAVNARDAKRVITVIRAFLNQQGAPGSQASTNGPTAPASGTGVTPTAPTPEVPAPSLESFAAPGRAVPGQSAPNPAQTGPKIWKLSEITAFYQQRARGAYRDRAAEADQIERDIAMAQREGRVTDG